MKIHFFFYANIRKKRNQTSFYRLIRAAMANCMK